MQKRNAPASHEDDQTFEFKATVMVSDGQAAGTDPVQYAVTPKLTEAHLTELHRSGISDDVINSSGIYTARNVEALPEPMRWFGSPPRPGLPHGRSRCWRDLAGQACYTNHVF